MPNPAHTPGPWTFRPSRQPQITSETDPNGRTVALVYDHLPDDERDANARLIAAAPALLAALERFAEAMKQRRYPELQGVACDAFAAVALARGVAL